MAQWCERSVADVVGGYGIADLMDLQNAKTINIGLSLARPATSHFQA